MSVGSFGTFEAGYAEAAESEFSAFDALAADHEALLVENRLLKREVRCLLDTIKCASEVMEKITEEWK